MGKTGHATWFRIYLGQKAFIDGSDDAVVGQALKAALHYFSTVEVQTLDGAAHALFCSFRESVDESDNVYTVCPICEKEHRVDISEVFSDGQSDLYGTAILCPICSAKRMESLKRTGGAL